MPTNPASCMCIKGYKGLSCEIQIKETYFWVILDFSILALILIAYKLYVFLRDVLRRRRNEQREESEKMRKLAQKE